MSQLTDFAAHCRRLAKPGSHRLDCTAQHPKPPRWAMSGDMASMQLVELPAPATCHGECVPETDRALFARLADETDAYLARPTDQPTTTTQGAQR